MAMSCLEPDVCIHYEDVQENISSERRLHVQTCLKDHNHENGNVEFGLAHEEWSESTAARYIFKHF